MTRDLTEALAFAEQTAHAAGALVLPWFGGAELDVERKPDDSPVTRADRDAEKLCRRRIEQRYPSDGILGEEYGDTRSDAEWRWVLDPIDGTRSFVRGVPLFGVLIALQHRARSVLGVMHFPALGETVSAAEGLGCRHAGKPASVSAIDRWDRSLVLTTDAASTREHGLDGVLHRLEQKGAMVRTWGDCYGHALVATGRAEAMIDPILEPWDVAALVPVVREAGGCFFDRRGAEQGELRSGIATNAALGDAVRELLAPRSDC